MINSFAAKGPALNKGEVAGRRRKKFPYGQQNGKRLFFLGTEKEEELKELVHTQLLIHIQTTSGKELLIAQW